MLVFGGVYQIHPCPLLLGRCFFCKLQKFEAILHHRGWWKPPLQINMEPTNGGLENDVPFQFGHFQVPAVHLGCFFFYCKLQKKEALKSRKSSDLELLFPYTQDKQPRHHLDDMFSFLGLGITKSQPKPAFKLLLLGLGW